MVVLKEDHLAIMEECCSLKRPSLLLLAITDENLDAKKETAIAAAVLKEKIWLKNR